MALAELGETTEDLFAEAKAELMAENHPGKGAAASEEGTPSERAAVM